MIAAWMLYCALCALGLSLAAVLAERLLAGRGPVRSVWISAVVLSVAVPALAFRFTTPATAPVVDSPVVGQLPAATIVDSLAIVPPVTTARAAVATPAWSWRAVLAKADTPLAIVWLTLSSALVAHFVCGMIALSWMRRWWRRDTVQGIDVLVSETTGPALVGALSPAIVVPEWTLSMDEAQVELMLRHEQEHRRARDGQLLTVAHLALVAMPWNVALWWQLMRLRVAVELDCDARVLRDADARSYGDLLLEVARPRRRLMLMGATAFAERASQLERRIRAIGGRRGSASRTARLGVATIGVVVVSAAWVAPRPPVPARAAPRPVTPAPAATPRNDSASVRVQGPALASAPSQPATPTMKAVAPESARAKQSPPPQARPGNDSALHHVAVSTKANDSGTSASDSGLARRTVTGNIIARSVPQIPATGQSGDSVFEVLFAGMALSPDQEAKARDLINQLEIAQAAQMANVIKALVASQPLRQALQAQADSGLENLVTNDADRALLRSRFTPPILGAGGGRGGGRGDGRSATLAGDSLILIPGLGGRSGRVGGGGGAGQVAERIGGGRGGARGGGGVGPAVDMTNILFNRYFEGISLTPQQEADARAIISKWLADMRATNPPIQPTIIARRRVTNQIAMSPESAAAFASLLSNDADRATLQSHIAIEVFRTLETPPR
jgi:beta-lactamase regulating signal transducer with metallopeptidase domain